MKIAIIINLFPPKWLAGTEIATYHLAEHLAKRSHEIHVITSLDEGLSDFEKENGFYVHRIIWPKIPIIGILTFWVRIFLKIRTLKPEIVHAQDLSMGIPAWLIKKILKIPYIVWGRGSDVYLPYRFIRITTKTILQNALAVLALTENMRIKLKKKYDTEIHVIPNGIDLEDYFKVSLTSKKVTNGKNILFVGSLYPVKGVYYLIKAMKKILEKVPDARLILVGDGKERKGLETLSTQLGISNHVTFIGKIPHEEVQTFFKEADVFVLPSLSEGFPNVILEAMACGLPIVATRVGGVPDILTDGTNGYLVEAKDTKDLINKVLLLLEDSTLRKKISDNNKYEVKKYSWENIIFELEKIYKLSIK